MNNIFNVEVQRCKAIKCYFAFFVLFVVNIFAVTVAAQETAVFQPTASHTFGQALQFRLSGHDHPAVTKATLLFTFPTADRIYAQQLTPSDPENVDLVQVVGVQGFGIRPFAKVTYWWELQTENDLITLPEQSFLYEDNQLAWETSRQPLITIHALPEYQIEEALAEQAQAIVAESLPRLQQATGLTLTTPIPLYIYPSTADFQRTAQLANYQPPPVATGADLGVLLQTAVNPRTASQDLARDLPRELVRLAIVQQTGRPYADLPAWVVEGLAILLGNATVDEDVLETAVLNQQTIPLESLCEAHLFVQNEALALAQSISILQFISQQHGDPVTIELLIELAQGADCANLLPRTLNIDTNTFTQQWLTNQQRQINGQQGWQRNSLWLLLLLVSSLLLVAAWLRQQ